MNWLVWVKSLAAAAIGGAANAGLLVIVAPDKFSFDDLSTLGRVAAAGALIAVMSYLKQSPLPTGSDG